MSLLKRGVSTSEALNSSLYPGLTSAWPGLAPTTSVQKPPHMLSVVSLNTLTGRYQMLSIS